MDQDEIKIPRGLFDKVMSRIHTEEKIAKQRRLIFLSLIFVSSLVMLFPSFKMLKEGVAQSGFIQFLSLIFSDFDVVLAYWRNFALVLLEALPVAGLAAFLTSVFILLGSLKFLVRDAKTILRPHTN